MRGGRKFGREKTFPQLFALSFFFLVRRVQISISYTSSSNGVALRTIVKFAREKCVLARIEDTGTTNTSDIHHHHQRTK